LDIKDCLTLIKAGFEGDKVKKYKEVSRFKKNYWLCILMIQITLIFAGCSMADTHKSIKDTQFIIGTVVTIQLFDTQDRDLLEGSFQILKDIDQKMSLSIEDSEMNQMNKEAQDSWFHLSDESYYVIQKSLEYSKLSDGAFDISLGPVIDLWQIGTDNAKVPGDDELKEALSHVDYRKIQLNPESKDIRLSKGMSLNLGGIAKGYAADQVSAYLKDKGIKKAILNLGGNIVVIGEKKAKTPFRVGLQDPFGELNDSFAVVKASNQTIVTSGTYERNFEKDGVVYHHILSSTDGYPVNNGVEGVTVVTDSSIDADALSTVLFTLGVEKGIKLCNSLANTECVYVTNNKKVYLSDKMGELFILTDDTFSFGEQP